MLVLAMASPSRCSAFRLNSHDVGVHGEYLVSVCILAKMAKNESSQIVESHADSSAKDAKYGFGRLIDIARAEPVAVAKHWRPVVVVLSVEEYDRAESATEHKCRGTSEKCRKIRKE